jgi:hypothetical protein
MLFADESVTTGNLLAFASVCVSGVLAYLQSRDKQKFDSERREMTVKITTLTNSHQECEKAHETTLSELATVRQRCDAAEIRSSHRDGEIAGINALVKGLQEELDSLRSLAFSKSN